MRFSAGEALSLISPFGRTALRMLAESERKSPRATARSARRGNFAASPLNVARRLAAVSANDAASRSCGCGENGRRHIERGQPAFGIGERAEAEFRSGSEIGDGFADPFEFFGESGCVGARREDEDGAAAGGACGAACDDFAEARKFEKFFGAAAHPFKMAEDGARVKEAGGVVGERIGASAGDDSESQR